VVCGRTDGDGGGEVLQVGNGAEGAEWGSVEFGSIELVRDMDLGGHRNTVYAAYLFVREAY